MNGISLISPPSEIATQFEEIVQPIFLNIRELTNKTTSLRRTRDLLLPKLISDEVDVECLDIRVDLPLGLDDKEAL